MQSWARFIVRTGWLWIFGWPAAALLIWLPAPRIPTLLADDDTGFLPESAPSQQALQRLREDFPDHAPASRAVIVAVREAGLTDADHAWLSRLGRNLHEARHAMEWRVLTTELLPFLAELFESPDGKAGIVVVDLPASMLTFGAVNRVRAVRDAIRQDPPPKGLDVHVTGSAAMGEMLDRHVKRDVDRTTAWALGSVTLILLLVYRSPTAVLLPILTIGVALMVALGTVGWAASWGLPTNGLVEMFIIVVLAGSGVDYCLFLFARFREEAGRRFPPVPATEHTSVKASSDVNCRSNFITSAADGRGRKNEPDVPAAVRAAVAATGSSILASGGTNVAGLSTLALGKNRDLYTTGPTIAFAMTVVTAAVLSFTPSLMRVAGRWLFWPARLDPSDSSPDRRNAWMRNMACADRRHRRSFWAAAGRLVTRFPRTVACVMFVVLAVPAAWSLRCRPLYDAYEEFPSESSFVHGASAYGRHFFGCPQISELTLLVSGDAVSELLHGPHRDTDVLDQIARTLAERWPVVYHRDLRHPLGRRFRPAARPSPAGPPSTDAARPGGSPGDSLVRQLARRYYVGQEGQSVRIDVGLAIAPRSEEAMDTIPRIRQAVAEAVARDAGQRPRSASGIRVDVAGETARYADIRELKQRDFRVIAAAAIVCIGAILILLVASAGQAVILISATLLTYFATYGATWWIFRLGFGLSGLSWQIDFLLFIVILSLGQDYNIYVLTRIREACRTLPVTDAIQLAIRRTGRVVSSCGVIMAAAFGSMFAGSLVLMKEFAVALALGILMDTFLVRPLLVPALLLLWLRRRSQRTAGAIA